MLKYRWQSSRTKINLLYHHVFLEQLLLFSKYIKCFLKCLCSIFYIFTIINVNIYVKSSTGFDDIICKYKTIDLAEGKPDVMPVETLVTALKNITTSYDQSLYQYSSVFVSIK